MAVSSGSSSSSSSNEKGSSSSSSDNNNNEKGTCMLIDVAISGDRNVIKKKPRRF
jgi:PAB1-binding protein PBP1